MGRKHRKLQTKLTLEALSKAAEVSSSVSGVLRYLGIKLAGGSHAYASLRIKELGIDTTHFTGNSKSANYVHIGGPKPKTPSEVLTLRTGPRRRSPAYRLRRALIGAGVPYLCVGCGLGDTWNGKTIILQVDHLNRNWMDDRKENLEFRCPNCHSQTLGYAGSTIDVSPKAIISRRKVGGNYTPVPDHLRKPQQFKGVWPTAEGLKFLVWQKPATEVAKDIGVTSTMVKKKCKELGIQTPGRGYWARQRSVA